MSSIRTFIAFETPEWIRNDVLSVQNKLKSSNAEVKWESVDKFHVTIKFLGGIEHERLPSVLTKIETIVQSHKSFEITYETPGCFPNLNNPRVLWVGCKNIDGTLESLKKGCDEVLAPLGFEIEERKFHPHLTLGRVKGDRNMKNLTSILKSLTFEAHTAIINSIVVMKSDLRPGGSVYTSLQQIELLH